MLKHKICMLGAFSVGKTSLVRRFVRSIFSDEYLTTVGVKIDAKRLVLDGTDLTLVIWDIHGEDSIQAVSESYLHGASGYFLVMDGTRGETVDTARLLHERVRRALGPLPFVALLNKCDLRGEWRVSDSDLQTLASEGWSVVETSARNGVGVELAFTRLGLAVLQGRRAETEVAGRA